MMSSAGRPSLSRVMGGPSRIVPEAHLRLEEIDKAIDGIMALRKRTGKITVDELLSARHEGHKY
jgi:hypothetical protein